MNCNTCKRCNLGKEVDRAQFGNLHFGTSELLWPSMSTFASIYIYIQLGASFFLFSLPWPNFCRGQATNKLPVLINPSHCLWLGSDESIWMMVDVQVGLSSKSGGIDCFYRYWEFYQIRFCNMINLLRKYMFKSNEDTRSWNYLFWFKMKQIWAGI